MRSALQRSQRYASSPQSVSGAKYERRQSARAMPLPLPPFPPPPAAEEASDSDFFCRAALDEKTTGKEGRRDVAEPP